MREVFVFSRPRQGYRLGVLDFCNLVYLLLALCPTPPNPYTLAFLMHSYSCFKFPLLLLFACLFPQFTMLKYPPSLLLLLGLVSTCMAHVCLYMPSQRPDKDGSIITATDWATYNETAHTLPSCRRNINVAPFENADSAQYGSVCGGNRFHPYLNGSNAWSQPLTSVPASNRISAGSTYTIWILLNVGHPDPTGARSTFIYIDFAPMSEPSKHSDFVPIGVLPLHGESTPNKHVRYDWQVPATWNVARGVLRIVYLTALTPTQGLVPAPAASGISNSYTTCADVSIVGLSIRESSAPMLANSLVSWTCMLMMAVLAISY